MKRILGVVLIGIGTYHGLAAASERFEQTRVFLERNVTDKDAEVVFKATTPSAGLAALKVAAPDGRAVIDFKAPASRLGIRQLTFESPEPSDEGSVRADFPAGTYTFSGSTVSGARLDGKAMLSHAFPDPAVLVYPRPDANGVPLKGLQVKWKSIPGVAAYVVVIEDEASGREIRTDLPADATTFDVPGNALLPGTEYKLAIGTVAKNGNASYIETAFTTAK